MKRRHVHISVDYPDNSITFHSGMFSVEPTVIRPCVPFFGKQRKSEPAEVACGRLLAKSSVRLTADGPCCNSSTKQRAACC